jgi:hypothetical protein
VRDCPFCLRPVANDAAECPNCHNQVDIFRTGYFVRPNLSRPKTAFIWVGAIFLLALLAVGIFRGCAMRAPSPTPAVRR